NAPLRRVIAIRQPKELVESLPHRLKRLIPSQMPFADASRRITPLAQHVGNRNFIRRQPMMFRPKHHIPHAPPPPQSPPHNPPPPKPTPATDSKPAPPQRNP